MEVIAKMLDSLNRYEVFTQLISGMFLFFLLEKCSHVPVPALGSAEVVVCCWLIGFVSGRVGGLLVEPIMKGLGQWHKFLGPVFVSREKYVAFKKINETWCKTLLTDANLYRTLFAGGVLIMIARWITAMQNCALGWTNGDTVLVVWCVLFWASYWRQVNMLSKNAEEAIGSMRK